MVAVAVFLLPAAALGPSLPNPNLNLAAIGLDKTQQAAAAAPPGVVSLSSPAHLLSAFPHLPKWKASR